MFFMITESICLVAMERRLVLYQLLDTDLTNKDMGGKMKQDLGYICFRRVPSKTRKSIFYLFFQREIDTNKRLLAAKKMKKISLARYRHRNAALLPQGYIDEFPDEELPFHPFHPEEISDGTRKAFSKYFEKFASRV